MLLGLLGQVRKTTTHQSTISVPLLWSLLMLNFFFDVLCKLVTMRKLSSDKLFVTFGEIETTVYAIGGQLLGY